MAKTIGSMSYENHYLLVASIFDLSSLVKILVKNKIFKLETGYSLKKTEFVNLFICRSIKIAVEVF